MWNSKIVFTLVDGSAFKRSRFEDKRWDKLLRPSRLFRAWKKIEINFLKIFVNLFGLLLIFIFSTTTVSSYRDHQTLCKYSFTVIDQNFKNSFWISIFTWLASLRYDGNSRRLGFRSPPTGGASAIVDICKIRRRICQNTEVHNTFLWKICTRGMP